MTTTNRPRPARIRYTVMSFIKRIIITRRNNNNNNNRKKWRISSWLTICLWLSVITAAIVALRMIEFHNIIISTITNLDDRKFADYYDYNEEEIYSSRTTRCNNNDDHQYADDDTQLLLGAMPILLVIGFQKSGTTAIRTIMMSKQQQQQKSHHHHHHHFHDVCINKGGGEPNYWSRKRFALNAVYPPMMCSNSSSEIYKDFLELHFGHCIIRGGRGTKQQQASSSSRNNNNNNTTTTPTTTNTVLFAKAPTLAMQPWVAPSLQSNLPKAKIAFLVRDPIERAFSGFIQGWDWIREAPSLKKKSRNNNNHQIIHPPITAQVFDDLVRLEISISQRCGIPNRMATGLIDVDWQLVYTFNRCCRSVSEQHGHKDWPGCDGYGEKIVPKTRPMSFPNFQWDWNKRGGKGGMEPSRGLGWQITPFGGYSFSFVREGVYIDNLRPWIRLYQPKQIHAYTMTELKSMESSVLSNLLNQTRTDNDDGNDQILRTLHDQKKTALAATTTTDKKPMMTDEILFASLNTTAQRKRIGFVPYKETITMLKEYYQTKNEELNQVFQKDLLLKYDTLN